MYQNKICIFSEGGSHYFILHITTALLPASNHCASVIQERNSNNVARNIIYNKLRPKCHVSFHYFSTSLSHNRVTSPAARRSLQKSKPKRINFAALNTRVNRHVGSDRRLYDAAALRHGTVSVQAVCRFPRCYCKLK